MEESPEWRAQLRTAEKEEQQLWENPGYPPTPRYAPEPCIPPPEVAEDWVSSPPRWLPEIPPTPRYEGSPQWTPARPPTPRFEQPPPQQQLEKIQRQQLEQPQREQPPPQQHQRERRQQQQTDPPQQQPENPTGQHIRTDIPAAHVSQSTRTFVAEGVRRRQQTVVWTWPEGPAEETAATEEPRIWEESTPRVIPLDPRTRGRPEPWRPPTPSTGPTTPASAATDGPTAAPEQEEPLERGPWVWPEPVYSGRPPLRRQHSAPKITKVVARPKLVRMMSAPESQRLREIAEHEWPERGPHHGRQAQRARMERGSRVLSPVGARGHESV
nr:extensin-like [Drosophila suzukii]